MNTIRNSKLLLALFALLLVFSGCKGESPTAPPTGGGGGGGGGTPTTTTDMTLTASSATPVVDSTVIITAAVTVNGNPAPNGTAVEFTSSTNGVLDGSGQAIIKTTVNGSATVSLTSTVAGTVTVRAVVANVSRNVTVTFSTKTVPPGPPNTAPSITSITPAIGNPAGGQTIRIIGKNFKTPVRVLFDTGAALPIEGFVVSSTETTIDVITPGVNLGAGQQLVADVILINAAGTANEARVEVEDGFTFRNEALTPIVSTASPNSGPVVGGTRVTIFGEAFQSPVQVLFGTAEARVIDVGYSQIIVEAPPARDTSDTGADPVTGAVNITVRNINSNQQTVLTAGFLYKSAVSIIAVSPGAGPHTGGTRVTIDGTGFVGPVAVVVRTGEGDVALQPISVSGTRIIALTPAVAVENCQDLIGPIVVTNIPTSDSATGPAFRFDVTPPIVTGITGANPLVPGSAITIGVLNAGLFPQIQIGDSGVAITGATTSNGITSLNVTIPTSIELDTVSCAAGGTRQAATSFDVTFISQETGCEVTVPGGLLVQPPQTGQFFLTPNPLELTATGDDPVTPEDETQNGAGSFTVVNTGNVPVTITGVTSSDPARFPVAGGTGVTLAPCESTVVVVSYNAGARGSIHTANITVSGTGGITAREQVVGRTQ
jgi:hypothetical protein